MSHGENMSFYVPGDKLWIKSSITKLQRRAEEKGVPLTKSQVIVWALEEALNKGEHEDKPLKTEFKSYKGLKRTIACRKKDNWVLEFIDKMVATKRASGLPTSFSYELFRLVKKSILAMRK